MSDKFSDILRSNSKRKDFRKKFASIKINIFWLITLYYFIVASKFSLQQKFNIIKKHINSPISKTKGFFEKVFLWKSDCLVILHISSFHEINIFWFFNGAIVVIFVSFGMKMPALRSLYILKKFGFWLVLRFF